MAELDAKATTTAETWLVYDRDDERTLKLARELVGKTLDCACLIVHSSLVERTGLRFDENLSFDLYAEDFCIAAQERHGIPIRIFSMNAHHWSAGTIGERYRRQLAYLRKKWPCVSYPSSCSFCIGGKKGLAWLNGVIKTSGIKTRLKAWLRVK